MSTVDVPDALTGDQRELLAAIRTARPLLITVGLHVIGPLDETVLRRALDVLTERHEPLRTCFPDVDGTPMTVIHDDVRFPVTVVGPGCVGGSDVVAAAMPPDVAPLARLTVLRWDDDEHELVFQFHPLVVDDRSLDVFFADLTVAYRAALAGVPPDLPALTVQHADWAAWRNTPPAPERVAELTEWWRRVLDGTDTPPAAEQPRWRRLHATVDARTTVMIEDLIRRERATGLGVFAAVFALTLRSSGRVVVRVPFANREQPQVDGLVGRFTRTLPVVLDLSGGPSLRQLLPRLRTAMAAAHSHQDLPDEILTALGGSSAYFAYRRVDVPLALPDCVVRLRRITHPHNGIGPALAVTETERGYHVTVDFDAATVRPTDADRLLTRYLATLRTAVAESAPADTAVAPAPAGEPDRHGLLPEQVALLREFRRFLTEEILPLDSPEPARRKAGAAGFLAPGFDPADGGRGLGVLATALLVEQAAATGSVVARSTVGPPAPTVPSPALARLSPVLAGAYLADLTGGRRTMCVAITERAGGSDLSGLATRAVRTGTGWSITGEKTYISHAGAADVALVIARTSDTGALHADLSAFLVPRDGYDVVDQRTMAGETVTATLRFTGTELSEDRLVSTVGNGLEVALSVLAENRVHIAAQALGIAQWCYDRAVARSVGRTAFGGALSELQGVSFPLVDCAVALESMRVLTYQIARRADQAGEVSVLDSSMLKLAVTEQAVAVADRCAHLMGADGLADDGGMEAALRYLRVLRIVEGSSELQRNVLSHLLGLTPRR